MRNAIYKLVEKGVLKELKASQIKQPHQYSFQIISMSEKGTQYSIRSSKK